MRKKATKLFDRIMLTHNKDVAALYRHKNYQNYLQDHVVQNTAELLGNVKKEFKNIAFIGSNPETFLKYRPDNVRMENFFLCDPSTKNLEISYDRVDKFKSEHKLNFNVYPLAVEEELWPFQDESLDLIITSLSLQWTNDLQVALARQLASLIPDGAMIGSIFGEDTLEELRMAFTLAENERSGGVSQHTSPLISAVDFGNLFARCEYNLPTIYSEKYKLLFDSPFHLMEFLQYIGESNALLSHRTGAQNDVIMAMAAIYQELFKDEKKPDKVQATFQVVNFLGWKYHESQQKPKKRGSAEFSLKVLQKEIEESLDPKENKINQNSGTIEVSDSDEESDKGEKSKEK